MQEEEEWRRARERRKGRAESVDSLLLLSDSDSYRPYLVKRGGGGQSSPPLQRRQPPPPPDRLVPQAAPRRGSGGGTVHPPPPPRPPKGVHLQPTAKRVSISSEAVIIADEYGDDYGEDMGENEEESFYSPSGSQSFRVGEDDEGEVYCTEDEEEAEESLSYHEEVKSSEEVYHNEVTLVKPAPPWIWIHERAFWIRIQIKADQDPRP
jgi:hypothetical protein